MTLIIVFVAFCLVLPALLMRLTFLASTRLGGLCYYTNVLSDFFPKRLGLPRGLFEISFLVLGLILFILCGSPFWWISSVVLIVVVGLELLNRIREREILNSVYAHLDSRANNPGLGGGETRIIGVIPRPSPHPDLVVNLMGPFISRLPQYYLGDIISGRIINLGIVIGNHSLIPCQTPIKIEVNCRGNLTVKKLFPEEIPPLLSGEVYRADLQLHPSTGGGKGWISISINCGDRRKSLLIGYESIFGDASTTIAKASINRYPGGCQAAFAWRGDMDLYDTSTFQSVEGLTNTLRLAARYRFPQTMYLSPRLSLVLNEATDFSEHFKVNRGYKEIPQFISWLKENVEMRHQIAYPFQANKPYLIELGNHMYLHYGTHTSAAPGNNWKLGAKMGEGNYDWFGDDSTSFGEQRDNAMTARRLCEELFHFTPLSGAIPDTTFDDYTPAAFEEAGCKVVSDSNASHVRNVILQPPPHHPNGTGVVELSKRYPGDPEDLLHAAMVQYWINRAHRRRIPVIFMCHQHMRQFNGHACARFTEYILRYVLTRFNGDLYVNTVYGIGIYWNEIFSPRNRTVYVENHGSKVIVSNTGQVEFSNVPVDITYQGNRRGTVLCDLSPNSSFEIGVDGKIERL